VRIGEAFVGSGPNAAHVNTVLGAKDGPVGTAWATALATPRLRHAPFVVVMRPNVAVKPFTLFVNKARSTVTRTPDGAAQAVAAGVIAALRKGADGAEPARASSRGKVQPEADDEGLVTQQRGRCWPHRRRA
jgi:5,6,7,8-tetrahydromethanopterin hydro-lyase